MFPPWAYFFFCVAFCQNALYYIWNSRRRVEHTLHPPGVCSARFYIFEKGENTQLNILDRLAPSNDAGLQDGKLREPEPSMPAMLRMLSGPVGKMVEGPVAELAAQFAKLAADVAEIKNLATKIGLERNWVNADTVGNDYKIPIDLPLSAYVDNSTGTASVVVSFSGDLGGFTVAAGAGGYIPCEGQTRFSVSAPCKILFANREWL